MNHTLVKQLLRPRGLLTLYEAQAIPFVSSVLLGADTPVCTCS